MGLSADAVRLHRLALKAYKPTDTVPMEWIGTNITAETFAALRELVQSGLWEQLPHGFVIKDWDRQ